MNGKKCEKILVVQQFLALSHYIVEFRFETVRMPNIAFLNCRDVKNILFYAKIRLSARYMNVWQTFVTKRQSSRWRNQYLMIVRFQPQIYRWGNVKRRSYVVQNFTIFKKWAILSLYHSNYFNIFVFKHCLIFNKLSVVLVRTIITI